MNKADAIGLGTGRSMGLVLAGISLSVALGALVACTPGATQADAAKTDTGKTSPAAGDTPVPDALPTGPIPFGDVGALTDPDAFAAAFEQAMQTQYPLGSTFATIEADLKASGFECRSPEANPAARVVFRLECQRQLMLRDCGHIWYVNADTGGEDGKADPTRLSFLAASFELLCLGAK